MNEQKKVINPIEFMKNLKISEEDKVILCFCIGQYCNIVSEALMSPIIADSVGMEFESSEYNDWFNKNIKDQIDMFCNNFVDTITKKILEEK